MVGTINSNLDVRQYLQFNGDLRVGVDENAIDIFQLFDQSKIPHWEPEITLAPYGEQKRIRFDLETTGTDPVNDDIKYIGVKIVHGSESNYYYFDDESEEKLLLNFFKLIERNVDAIFLSTYNGFDFDWKFIFAKVEKYDLDLLCPFKMDNCETVFKIAQLWSGNPATYQSVRFKDRRATAIIDLFHQVLAWDFSMRKLDTGKGGRSLKTVPVTIGLRNHERVELSYQDIQQSYQSAEGRELLKQYLKDDLDDTDLIGNFLEPSIYYQKLFLPTWHLQSISTSGNGSKWGYILSRCYNAQKVIEYVPVSEDFLSTGEEDVQYEEIKTNKLCYLDKETGEYFEVEPDYKLTYQGALTFAKAGLFKNVCKYDFESLYPHIQLIYGICSRKDPKLYQLAVLKYCLNERLKLKKMKADKTIKTEDIQREASLKIFINSSYGFTGAGHLPFNDMEAAALITGYARALFKRVKKTAIKFDDSIASAIPVSFDTDGFSFAVQPEYEDRLLDYIVGTLPTGFKLKEEWRHPIVFVPPDSESLESYTQTNDSRLFEGTIEGLKKNYIIITAEGKAKVTGRYRKRDQSKLVREFQCELLKRYHDSGYYGAKRYYHELVKRCINRELPIEYIIIKRKARVNEKEVFTLGLVDEEGYTSYYEGHLEVHIRRKKDGTAYKADVRKAAGINTVKTNSEPYSVKYYCKQLEDLYREVMIFVDEYREEQTSLQTEER